MRARALSAIVGLALGLGGAAAAADLSLRNSTQAQRAGMLTFYDHRPGVVVRAYWRAPWQHRHYYPTTGQQPRIGRYEDLSAGGEPPPPAESYRRSWSASSVFFVELPNGPERDFDAEPAPPHAEPPLK